jgi:hypothetical protein
MSVESMIKGQLDSREFSEERWIDLLFRDYGLSGESTIIIVKIPKSQVLRIRKADFCKHFPAIRGFDFAQGDEVEIAERDDGGMKAEIPDRVMHQLELKPNDVVCVTKRNAKFFMKKLVFSELVSPVPGHIVIDKFGRTNVQRTYTVSTDLAGISYSYLDQLVSRMGELKDDPVSSFKDVDGRVGFLARKEFMRGLTDDDLKFAEDYKLEIGSSQLEDGSWDGSQVKTAFNVIRLLEVGATVKDHVVAEAAKWLLSTSEPIGLPGLFMHSEDLVQRFNNWKGKSNAKGRPYRGSSKGEVKAFLENADLLPNISGPPCELRVTWSSAIVLEALLRCGLADEARVVKAVNTLVALSGHSGGWCGCGYLDARVNIPAMVDSVDFNKPFPVPQNNIRHSIDWFITPKDIQKLTCGEPKGSAEYVHPNYVYKALRAGPDEALIAKHYRTTGECPMVMHRALSYHPRYHRSNLEVHGALRCAWRQSSNGTWGGAYLSSMFGFLERIVHPLSAFLVARSVPLLIREQGEDGFWEDKPQRLTGEPEKDEPPSKEEGTLMILRALKRFRFLRLLWPHCISA